MGTEYIKKCPFCGSLAEPRRYYNSYEGTKYFITCIQCGATSSHRPTEEYAVEQWNKRVEEAQYKQRTSKIAELLTEAYNLMSEEEKNNLLYKGYYENISIDEAMDFLVDIYKSGDVVDLSYIVGAYAW